MLHPTGVDLAKYKYTPFAVNAANALWSPDGRMAAYAGKVGDDWDLFLRALDSPTPRQLTHDTGYVEALGWTPDSSHIIYFQHVPGPAVDKLMSVGTVGGEPDPLWTIPDVSYQALAVSPDAKTAAVLGKGSDGLTDLYISQPIGSPLRRYPSSPLASHAVFNSPQMRFSPDGKRLLAIRAGDSGMEESWLLPWPPGSGTPRKVLEKLPHEGGTPIIGWMPDNRRIVASTDAHLFLADTGSDRLQQLTQGTGSESEPAVSPDGRSILFAEERADYDILSMSVADGSTQGLIVTARSESMPAWAAKANALVYASDRLGPEDLWLHAADGPDRPLVTRASFSSDPPRWMFGGALSPDGSRVIFDVVTSGGKCRLWEASVAGGAPVALLDVSEPGTQFAGDWSPDGSQFVFLQVQPDGSAGLNVVRTSGGSRARTLVATGVRSRIPSWSPDGQWIAYYADDKVWHLISPDGARRRDLVDIDTPNLGYSKDGRTAYGIRSDGSKWYLFSLDIATARLRDIRRLDSSLRPASNLNPAIRFTVAPDGKSFAYPIVKSDSSLWMLQGFEGK